MENTDNKLDNLISNLRQQKPELNNAGLLTESIMKEIKSKSQYKKPTALIWIRIISSSAAVILMGLFLFQQTESEKIATNYRSPHIIKNHINIDSICMENLKNKQANLVETYYCYMQQNYIKNNRFKTNIQQSTN